MIIREKRRREVGKRLIIKHAHKLKKEAFNEWRRQVLLRRKIQRFQNFRVQMNVMRKCFTRWRILISKSKRETERRMNVLKVCFLLWRSFVNFVRAIDNDHKKERVTVAVVDDNGDDEKMVVLRRAFVRWRMSSLERKRNRTEKKNVELELRCDEVITMKEREREKTSMQRLCLHILRKAALKEIDGGENYNHVSDDDIIRRELLRSILLKQRKMLVDEINRIER
jgi:hypothetical protein